MRRIVAAILLTASAGMMQELAAQAQQAEVQNLPQDASTNQKPAITVPAGTTVALSLTRPLWAKTANVGGVVYTVTAFPVAVGNDMAIPPGTYVEGRIDTLTRPHWLSPHAEFQFHFTKLVFANGYTVELPDVSENMMSVSNQGGSASITASRTASAAEANAMVDIEAAVARIYVEVTANNDVLLDNGAPIEMLLQAPLLLDADAVAAAVRGAKPLQLGATKSSTRCMPTPGTTGTPDTVIPGSPGTPPTVIPGAPGFPDTVIAGTPATPDTVIPGTPGFPGTSCPGPPIVTSEPIGKDAHTKTVMLTSGMQVGGKLLSAGKYQIRWTGLGPTAQVEITENKKQVVQAPARVLLLGKKSTSDEVVPRSNADGSVSLVTLEFAGESFALFFD
jgi:hypothetical protein